MVSNSPCPVVANTCGVNNCGSAGPVVCARQNGAQQHGYVTAKFANQCQLAYYNCVHPTKAFTAYNDLFGQCKSIKP